MDYSTQISTIRLADNQLRSKLQETGGAQNIYDAMDTVDMAEAVRAATAALEKAQALPVTLKQQKSKSQAIMHREAGNRHYINGEHKLALTCYKKSLATAPKNTLELQMAYSNITAVMLKIKAYQGCQLNIKACEDAGCPPFLATKLERRMEESQKFIMGEMMQDIHLRSDEYLRDYTKFTVPRNAEVPCASEDICVLNTAGRKKVVAARDIKSGTMVAMERAYVSTQPEDGTYTSCHYCHKINFILIPCDYCQTLFCSEKCMKKCLADYHRIECQIMGHLETLYMETSIKLMTRAVIKMSLKLNWKQLSDVSKLMGERRSSKSSVKDMFDANVPASILCNDDQKTVYPGKIYNGSIVCAAIVHCLALVPGYLPAEEDARKEAIEALSRILMHLYTTFTNKIQILCSAYDLKTEAYRCGIQCNVGWFSFTSKLPHSCEPNLFVMGLNDHVALVALQRIKKGDELTISYIDHFYDMKVPRSLGHSHYRQKLLRDIIQTDCKCRVCLLEWDSTTQSPAKKLTPHQEKCFRSLEIIFCTSKFSDRFKVAAEALNALTGFVNTTEHNSAYMVLRSALHLCQCMHALNKAYEVRALDNILINK